MEEIKKGHVLRKEVGWDPWPGKVAGERTAAGRAVTGGSRGLSRCEEDRSLNSVVAVNLGIGAMKRPCRGWRTGGCNIRVGRRDRSSEPRGS